MLSGILTGDRSVDILALLLVYAGLLPTAMYLTIILRESSSETRSLLERLHLLTRTLIRENARNLRRLVQRGVDVRPAEITSDAILVSQASYTALETVFGVLSGSI